MQQLTNETFSLRSNETIELYKERPKSGRWIAIMARTTNFPEGPHQKHRTTDNAQIMHAAIIAAELNQNNEWIWVTLSAPTKELIGDFMFDIAKTDLDTWYYLTIK